MNWLTASRQRVTTRTIMMHDMARSRPPTMARPVLCEPSHSPMTESVSCKRPRTVGCAVHAVNCMSRVHWQSPPTSLHSKNKPTRPSLTGANSKVGSPHPHLHQDWAHPTHICTRTGLTTHICTRLGSPPTSAPGLGSPHPHLHQDSCGLLEDGRGAGARGAREGGQGT